MQSHFSHSRNYENENKFIRELSPDGVTLEVEFDPVKQGDSAASVASKRHHYILTLAQV
jgi:hypothetical protein